MRYKEIWREREIERWGREGGFGRERETGRGKEEGYGEGDVKYREGRDEREKIEIRGVMGRR